MIYVLEMAIFHSYVKLPEGIMIFWLGKSVKSH
jgi:hypothetical protein